MLVFSTIQPSRLRMKKLLIIFILLIGTIFLLNFQKPDGTYLLSYSACDKPITYRIGFIDPRFNLSRETVLTRVQEAAALWNHERGKPVFVYDPNNGHVTIRFVYDRRQELSSEVNQLERQLTSNKNSLDPQIAAYKEKSEAFEKKVAEMNQQIDYWNSQGGAPPKEYERLRQEQLALEKEAEELNKLAYSLNQSTRAYNLQVRELDKTVKELNRTLRARPEEGLFDAATNTITIYFLNSQAELIHTLAHELGHARGLWHTDNPDAIMYGSSTETITLASDDRAMLEAICQDRTYTDLFIERFVDLLRNLLKDRKNSAIE